MGAALAPLQRALQSSLARGVPPGGVCALLEQCRHDAHVCELGRAVQRVGGGGSEDRAAAGPRFVHAHEAVLPEEGLQDLPPLLPLALVLLLLPPHTGPLRLLLRAQPLAPLLL